MLRGPECEGILGQAWHSSDSPSPLLTALGTLSLFLCPRLKITLMGKRCKMSWKYNSIHMTVALRR